ncbi:Putative INO80 complex subunit B-like region, INO80 complex, subunit Ies2 [Septoria linicola]|uniref:INO80 complex subunit B-like region, INO80 complex, subunit Ies2 n=1 Tax=Septoria linicola TaxID=215465 RepID=A0A9Q9B5D1_9PEZI|nr:putative INO80 complex subunit B-like region, INO80 complex, subunit Ies2 [Septoria linicola]USW57456.1 Putative INO80 complex subunit B-like region, INO80 complex, subunit Ies2 [Septoria linicola]
MAPSRRSARAPTNPRAASSASLARPANGKTSLRLTVKAPPSKLRQATSGSAIPPNPYAIDQSESDATPAPPRRAARATRNPRKIVDADSDDMDDEEPDQEPEEDVDQSLLGNEDSEEDAEGEEDEDVDMEDHPPPPVITQQRVPGKAKPQVSVTAPPEGTLKSVEAKEMEDDDDDDELSELDSQEEEELEGNGEEEDEEDEEEDDSEDDDEDNSRSATPDLSKLTKRQRGAYNEFEGAETNELMALSNEALKKKELTAEEHVQRRAEMARRRKNLSEKRNEEEKMETIHKLLHKQAPKRRTRAEMEAARAAEAGETPAAERDANALDPTYVRWVSRKEGSLVCVPQAWQDAPVGEQFGFSSSSGRMVEEVQ